MSERGIMQDAFDRNLYYAISNGQYMMEGTKAECEAWLANKNVNPIRKKPRASRVRRDPSQLELGGSR